MSWAAPRRFWTRAVIRPGEGGFHVELDDRPLQTPARRPLLLPTAALAEAVAAEWNAVEAELRPERLPFTRAANSALDRVEPDPGPVVEAIAAYGDSDLVCYRAEAPPALVRRQSEAWDPWLAWAARDLGAPLRVVAGVMHRPQPPASLDRLRAAVAAHDAFALTALHDLVSGSGSLVLGLAVAREALDAAEAWRLSRLDEDWQAGQWGRDAEAEAASAVREADFKRASRLLDLLRHKAPD